MPEGNSKKVSIIVPVYNKSPYINDCLDSLKRQTYQHLEILVIDDGSTDDSWEKLIKIDGISLFQIPHSGPSAARNKGLDEATGEFVTFVDADDFAEPGYIEHLVQGIGDADLCLSGHKTWFQRENRWVEERCPQGVYESYIQYGSVRRLLGGIGWKLYRLRFLKERGIVFPEEIDLGEDSIFSSRALLYLQKISCIDHCEYVIRKHDLRSLSHQWATVEIEEKAIQKYKKLERTAADSGLKEYYKGMQISRLSVIGRILCYRDMRMKDRKKLFFSTTKKYNITGFHHDHSAQTITSIALLTHTFLPFYLITKLFYWKNDELRGSYAPEAGR